MFNTLLQRASGSGSSSKAATRAFRSAALVGVSCVAIAAASAQTYSIVNWGSNNSGQQNLPSPNTGYSAISGGGGHTMALKSGAVLAWGSNTVGQSNVPSAALSGVSIIAAGNSHSLAIKNGAVLAWGWNGYKQCSVPGPNKNFVGISGGREHSVGIKSNGTVVCWGGGLLNTGIVPDFGQSIVPAGLTDVVANSAGGNHSVALQSYSPEH